MGVRLVWRDRCRCRLQAGWLAAWWVRQVLLAVAKLLGQWEVSCEEEGPCA